MNCYKCKFRGSVVGSAHSRCNVIKSSGSDKSSELEFLIASGMYELINKETNKPLVVLNQYGVNNGWATWPIDFDPIWVESCSFETIIDNG